MKLFLIFMFFISFLDFNIFQKDLCETKMTKAELIDGKLTFNCDYYKNQKLTSFKIKIPNKPTVLIYGDSLYNEARTYVKNLKKGDILTFFDIKTQREANLKNKPSVVVTIID